MARFGVKKFPVGKMHTLDFRLYFEDVKKGFISPFHDIPLFNKDKHHGTQECSTLNMIVEIPRWSNAKMEISKFDCLNPIKQDTKKGKLRYVPNLFPYHGYIWNYGAFPQTYEDPQYRYEATHALGDNDPIDVIEIGNKVHECGSIVEVKVLGVMALIDEGETDWKVVAIDTSDELADVLNDIDDVDRHMPGLLKHTNRWFRLYKVPAGKGQNTIALDGKFMNAAYALDIINHTHSAWKKLIETSGKPANCSESDRIKTMSCETNTETERNELVEKVQSNLTLKMAHTEYSENFSSAKGDFSKNQPRNISEDSANTISENDYVHYVGLD